MYPFVTNKKIFIVKSSEICVQHILKANIIQNKLQTLKWNDQFYGEVWDNKAVFELGHSPIKNAWRPIVTLIWSTRNNETEIISFYSLDKVIYLSLLIIPIFGLYLSIEKEMFAPFLITSVFYLVIMYGLNYFLYSVSKKNTNQILNSLLKKIP